MDEFNNTISEIKDGLKVGPDSGIKYVDFSSNSNKHDLFSDIKSDPRREIRAEKIKVLMKKVRFFSFVKKTLIAYSKFQKGFFYVEPFFRILAYIYLLYHLIK